MELLAPLTLPCGGSSERHKRASIKNPFFAFNFLLVFLVNFFYWSTEPTFEEVLALRDVTVDEIIGTVSTGNEDLG